MAAEAARDEPSGAGATPEMFELRPQSEAADAEGDEPTERNDDDADDTLSGLFEFGADDASGDAFGIAAMGMLLPHGHRSGDDGDGGEIVLPDIDLLIDHEVGAMEGLIEDMRAEIIARYAGYMIAARKTVPRGEIMGVISALKAQRNAELAAVKAACAKALSKRIKEALEARRAMRWRPRPPEARP